MKRLHMRQFEVILICSLCFLTILGGIFTATEDRNLAIWIGIGVCLCIYNIYYWVMYNVYVNGPIDRSIRGVCKRYEQIIKDKDEFIDELEIRITMLAQFPNRPNWALPKEWFSKERLERVKNGLDERLADGRYFIPDDNDPNDNVQHDRNCVPSVTSVTW